MELCGEYMLLPVYRIQIVIANMLLYYYIMLTSIYVYRLYTDHIFSSAHAYVTHRAGTMLVNYIPNYITISHYSEKIYLLIMCTGSCAYFSSLDICTVEPAITATQLGQESEL